VRCLKNQYDGEVEIHFLTKKGYLDLLQFNPYIDKIHTIEESHKEVLEDLKAEKFDFIIDLHHNLRTLRVRKALKAPSFPFSKLNIEKWMLVNFKKDNLPDVHIVDRYMKTLESFNIKYDQKGLDFFFSKDYQFPTSLYNVSQKYIAFVIGAKFNTKRLSTEKIEEICSNQKLPIVLIGGKEEEEEGNAIAKKFDHVDSMCGKVNLMDSAHLVKNAQVVICHDTGLMHIASAFQKNIVSIWGNTVPKFGMYAFNIESNYSIHEVPNLSCRPCSKIGFKECPKKHFDCMNKQDINQIQEKIDEFISQS
jgi:ADP-heptose:LPS heptosyltransferase